MFWDTHEGLQIPSNQLKPFDGILVGFTRDKVEVHDYMELRTTFSNSKVASTIIIKSLFLPLAFETTIIK